jgi:hypothetical protein
MMAPLKTISASVSPVASVIGPAALELERIDGQHFLADFVATAGVQQCIETGARADAQVMRALWTDHQIRFEVGAIQHRFAGWTFEPQAGGDG